MDKFTRNQIDLTTFVVDINGHIDWHSREKGTAFFKTKPEMNKFIDHIAYSRFVCKHKSYQSSNSVIIYLY